MLIPNIISEKVGEINASVVTKMGFSRCLNISAHAKRGIRYAISHAGELVITGSDMFIPFLSGQMQNRVAAKACEENEAIYSGLQITKVRNGSDCFTCIILAPNSYGVRIRDILILPEMA